MNQLLLDKYLNPISFGIDEQLITLCAVLSGYLNFPQHRIIIALIIMAFSNSLPDCLSYYDEKIGEKMDKKEAMKLSLVVFLSEMLSTLIVLLPIIMMNNTKAAIATSYVLIFIILISVNYYRDKDIEGAIMKLPLYVLVGFTIWFISKMAQKYFKVSV